MQQEVTLKEIKKKIRSVIEELMGEEAVTLGDEQLFVENLGMNSIIVVQVFLTCEETYGVELTDEMKLVEPLSIEILAEKIYKKLHQ